MADLPAGRQARDSKPKVYYVYIIQSLKTKQFYKGLANNLEQRLKQHEQGKVLFTKNKHPLKLVHVEICSSRTEAREMEKFFKSGFGREIIREIANS